MRPGNSMSVGGGFGFIGDRERLLDARSDGRTAQIIASQKKARKARQAFVDRSQPIRVAEMVLRKGARPNCDVAKNGGGLDREQSGNLTVNDV